MMFIDYETSTGTEAPLGGAKCPALTPINWLAHQLAFASLAELGHWDK